MRPRVLIVEDDVATRNALVTLLENDGCEVHTASDGERAFGLLEQNRYAAILLDLVLPKLSGTDIMEHLLCTRPEVLANIIVVTGLDVREIRKLFPSVCDALSKPLMPGRLLNTVRNCIRGPLQQEPGEMRGVG